MLDEKVKATIEAIRPAIQADGGDIYLRGVDVDTGVVQVELVGACVSCPASTVTLKAGIERILKDRVEGVTEVVNVGETLLDGTPVVARDAACGGFGPSVGSARWPTTPRTCSTPRGSGDRAALARLLSLVERGGDEARAVGRLTHPAGGAAYTVGITGAPGRGQVDAHQRRPAASSGPPTTAVAVLAIDPSSPFTGGAILGDRVRMSDHATDDGVFIRSMATRGHLGGLSLATLEAVRVLDAAGWPWVVIETVGVGQVEVEVAGAADTTVVVVNPGWGDAVQANKAGLLEIADVFVINKADRPGADETRRDLERMLDLTARDGWRPPVVATDRGHRRGGAGAVGRHRRAPPAPRPPRARSSRGARRGCRRSWCASWRRCSASGRSRPADDGLEDLSAEVAARRVDPWSAAEQLLLDKG